MGEPGSLLDFARWLNEQAKATIADDGEHTAMFFVRLPDGRVRPQLFDHDEQRPVGERRAEQMATAVRMTGADTIAFVSEAWAAQEDTVPEGGGAGNSVEAMDVLVVAALDREDNLVVFETPIHRAVDGSAELGESARMPDEYQVTVFDPVREIWRI